MFSDVDFDMAKRNQILPEDHSRSFWFRIPLLFSTISDWTGGSQWWLIDEAPLIIRNSTATTLVQATANDYSLMIAKPGRIAGLPERSGAS